MILSLEKDTQGSETMFKVNLTMTIEDSWISEGKLRFISKGYSKHDSIAHAIQCIDDLMGELNSCRAEISLM